MEIYTGKSDSGETCGGEKCNCNVEAMGKIDELIAGIDFAIVIKPELNDKFDSIHNKLAGICSSLCVDKKEVINEEDIKQIENWISDINQKVKVDGFVRFKTEQAGRVNECRVRCRALEREIVRLSKEREINKNILAYLNRLSDYFFILAVSLN